jgi:hypothetical protein
MADKDPEVAPADDAARTISLGLGSVLEQGDEIELQTHSGTKIRGMVEDLNITAVVVRDSGERLYFVPFTSIDSAEILESADENEGDDAETPADASVVDAPPEQTARS